MPNQINPTLEQLIEKAREYMLRMSPEELNRMWREQTISFAWGNVKLSNPAVTREMVEQEYDYLHSEDAR